MENNENNKIIEDISKLKKDVYFSYVSKINLRYIYKDIYTVMERYFIVKNQLRKDYKELNDLMKLINTKEIKLDTDEQEELRKIKKTKEIAISGLEIEMNKLIKKDTIGQGEEKIKHKYNKKFLIILSLTAIISIILKVVI